MTIRISALRSMVRQETAADRLYAGLSTEERAAYLRKNPNSRYAATAADWFSKMSKEHQEEYKHAHPHSKYAGGASDTATMVAHHQGKIREHGDAAANASSSGQKRAHEGAMDWHRSALAFHRGSASHADAMTKSHEADRVSWGLHQKEAGKSSSTTADAPARRASDDRVPTGTNAKKTWRHLAEHHGAKVQTEHSRGYHEIHGTMPAGNGNALHKKLVGEGWSHTDKGNGSHMYRHMGRGGYLRRKQGGAHDTWAVHGDVKK